MGIIISHREPSNRTSRDAQITLPEYNQMVKAHDFQATHSVGARHTKFIGLQNNLIHGVPFIYQFK